MEFEGAFLKHENVEFAVVLVKPDVIADKTKSTIAIKKFMPAFNNKPVCLMSLDELGRAKFYGRTDLVRFLKSIHLRNIPWKAYKVREA